MSNPIPVEYHYDNDEFNKCQPCQSGSTANTGSFDHSNVSKGFSSLLFELQNDDEFNELNQQMNQIFLDDSYRPSLIQAFQADMSSYLSHDKLTKNSRKMQQEYQIATLKEKEYVFSTFIKDNIVNFSLDKYMHYILEKIIEVGPLSQRNFILDQIFPHITKLIKDLHSCKVVQKGLEIMSQFPEESQTQYQSYKNFILQDNSQMRKIYVDKIANQIIQKSLDVFNGDDLFQLLKIVSQYILNNNEDRFELSTDQYGCLIVNKIIDIFPSHYDANTKQISNNIISKAIENSSCLVRRQYANYIVQQILEKGQEQHKRLLLDYYLIKDFVSMSMDKYGSNVAEKAIIYAGPAWRSRLWEEEVSISESSFRKLVNDQFANYPIQKLYEYLDIEYRNEFIELLTRLHESNFLNHHGQIVLKFALTNYNNKKFAQKIVQSEKTTKLQEKNKSILNYQSQQQQFQYNPKMQYQQLLLQQQYQLNQSQLPISPQEQQLQFQSMVSQQQRMFQQQHYQQQQFIGSIPLFQQQQYVNQMQFEIPKLPMEQPVMTQEQQFMMYKMFQQQQQCNQKMNQRNGPNF